MNSGSNNKDSVETPPSKSYTTQLTEHLLQLRQRANDGLLNVDELVNMSSPNPACRQYLGGVRFHSNTNLGQNYLTREPFDGNTSPIEVPPVVDDEPSMDNAVLVDNAVHLQDISVSH